MQRGRWAVFSAAFHRGARSKMTSSLTAESPTIRSFNTSLVSIQGLSPPVSYARGKTRKCSESVDPHLLLPSRLLIDHSFTVNTVRRSSSRGSMPYLHCYDGNRLMLVESYRHNMENVRREALKLYVVRLSQPPQPCHVPPNTGNRRHYVMLLSTSPSRAPNSFDIGLNSLTTPLVTRPG